MKNPLQDKLSKSYFIENKKSKIFQININKAKEFYGRLIDSPFYNKERGLWNEEFSQRSGANYFYSTDQLLGVIALASIGENNKAKEFYCNIIDSPFYDRKEGLWGQFQGYKKLLLYPTRYSTDQLLGVIALASIGENNKAKEFYWNIIDSPFYDQEETNYWNHNDCQEPLDITRLLFSTDQLLGVIALASIGENNKAKEFYERIVSSSLYDKEVKFFNHSMDENQKIIQIAKDTADQLFGVIALTICKNNK